MYETILVPLDGSQFSENAVEHGFYLAEKLGARCHILYVEPLETFLLIGAVVPFYPSVLPVSTASDRFRVTEETLHSRFYRKSVECTYNVRRGAYPLTVLDEARKIGADLIVKASRQLTGLTRWMTGGSSREVSEGADCPVLLVQGQALTDPLHHHTIATDVIDKVTPHLELLADRVGCDENIIVASLPEALEILMEGLAAEHHTGPGLTEIIGQLRFYDGGVKDVGEFLSRGSHGVDVGLVAMICCDHASATAKRLASHSPGLTSKQALSLLAYLSVILLTVVTHKAESNSEVSRLIDRELAQTRIHS